MVTTAQTTICLLHMNSLCIQFQVANSFCECCSEQATRQEYVLKPMATAVYLNKWNFVL